MAITIAQKKKQFAHYDLHSFNVMMKKCDKDTVFLYNVDSGNQFCVPTHGHYPVIIDFGFSYIKDMDDGPLWTSLAHTDVGFMSDRFDWVADPKLFLVTVSSEIKEKRGTKKSKIFRRIVRNIFDPLTIDWDCGWDETDDRGAADYITELVEEYNKDSPLFTEYDHYCMDILQSLVILPVEQQNYKDIAIPYKAFMSEWVKIESEIRSPFYNLYILKGVVDAARYDRAAYAVRDTRPGAISTFRKRIYEQVDKVASFCQLKNVHFEKMLCSLHVLSKNIEGVLYDVISERMHKKEKEYRKMPLQSIEQIYAAIESNIEDDYVYSDKTTVVVFDCVKGTSSSVKLNTDQANAVNELHPLCRGTAIYELINL